MTSFDAQMTSHAREIGPALVENYDWHDVSRIADVGGGSGELLRIVLDSCRNKTGTIIEFADAVQRAKNAMNDAVCAERCEVVEANFLDHVPSVADAYLLSWILHDWNDDARDDHTSALPPGCRDARPRPGHREAVRSGSRLRARGPSHARVRWRSRTHTPGVRDPCHPQRPPGRVLDPTRVWFRCYGLPPAD